MEAQATAGNAAVQGRLPPADPGGGSALGAPGGPPTAPPDWTREDIVAAQTELRRIGGYVLRVDGVFGPGEDIVAAQTELRRIGGYVLRVDGVFGPGTATGLTEAFGNHQWRLMEPAAVVAALRSAQATTQAARGEHDFRWGAMTEDGVLDITLGLGFVPDNPEHARMWEEEIRQVHEALAGAGFTVDNATAARLYQQAGRRMGQSATGEFHVKTDALTWRPPVGEPRSVHAVVRLLYSSDGSSGADNANAFQEGMMESDIAYYAGHGRYGTGPDFDRNFRVYLIDEQGRREELPDYHDLEPRMRAEGRAAHRTAWAQFEWRVEQRTIDVVSINSGNLLLAPDATQDTFGARLMRFALRGQGGDAAAQRATGAGGTLDRTRAGAAGRDREYRLWVFDGCNTRDFVRAIRGTPGQDERSTDIVGTNETVMASSVVPILRAFLGQMLATQPAERVIRAMDEENMRHPEDAPRAGVVGGHGLQDNTTGPR